MIEIADLKRGNIYLHFGDFEFLNPPRPFLLDDFKNSIDHLRIRDVLLDEKFDLSSFPSVVNVPKSVFAALPRSRNPFEILKLFLAIPPVSEKKSEAGNLVDSELIARASEQSLFECCRTRGKQGCKLTAGPTSIDSVFKRPVDEGPSNERNKEKKAHLITIKSNFNLAVEDLLREREKDKAYLITIMNNYDISSKIIKENFSPPSQQLSPFLANSSPSPPVSGFCKRPKSAKGSNFFQAPKILKHYIRKRTSFNNLWTALLKSEFNDGCALKVPLLVPSRIHRFEPSISECNPDLLEVYSSKIRTSNYSIILQSNSIIRIFPTLTLK